MTLKNLPQNRSVPSVRPTTATFGSLTALGICRNHRDRSIHSEIACQLHDVKMTQNGLLQKGLTSADYAEQLYLKIFETLIKKSLYLRYADVKLVF